MQRLCRASPHSTCPSSQAARKASWAASILSTREQACLPAGLESLQDGRLQKGAQCLLMDYSLIPDPEGAGPVPGHGQVVDSYHDFQHEVGVCLVEVVPFGGQKSVWGTSPGCRRGMPRSGSGSR